MEPVPWGFRRRQSFGGHLTGGEVSGIGVVSEDPGRGIPQAPAVRLHRNSEVTPTGVGIRAAGHPRHQRRLMPGGKGAT